MRNFKYISIVFCLLGVLLLANTASAEYTYTETLSSLPTGFDQINYVEGINNDNNIVLTAYSVSQDLTSAFLYDSGTYTPVMPPEWNWSFSHGINDNGVVLGVGEDSNGLRKYFTATPVVPEPVSSTLFIIGGVTLGFRRLRKRG